MNRKATIEDVLAAVLETGRCQVTGFGVFTIKDRKAYTGRNPSTGEPVEIPAKRRLHFKPSSKLNV